MTWHDHVLHFARHVHEKVKQAKEKLKIKKEEAATAMHKEQLHAEPPREQNEERQRKDEKSVMITRAVSMHKRRVEREELIRRATAPLGAQRKLGRHARHRRLIQHATRKFKK